MKKTTLTFLMAVFSAFGTMATQTNWNTEVETYQTQKKLIDLEQQLISDFNKMQEDPELSNAFAENFYKIINENPESLNYDFKLLKEKTSIYIETSKDKKLRFYSWDNNSGGTMHFFDQIIQYKDNNKIYSKLQIASEDTQAFISKIYTLNTTQKENIYFVIENAIYSTSGAMQSIAAYKISDKKLIPTKAFKTKTQTLSAIHCEFDFFSVVDRPERPVELIKIKNNTLYIPLINEQGTVTNKNLIYKWEGLNFKYEGIK